MSETQKVSAPVAAPSPTPQELDQALTQYARLPTFPLAVAWIEDAELVAHGVTPWVGLPLWLPPSEPDSAGFMTMDCARAQSCGLATQPLAQTISDTADWLAARDNAGAWKHVLTADAERTLVTL